MRINHNWVTAKGVDRRQHWNDDGIWRVRRCLG
jgi:hypothetical protein